MPKVLRWKVLLILLVLVMAVMAVYPIRDTLVYRAYVIDTLDENEQPILKQRKPIPPREFAVKAVEALQHNGCPLPEGTDLTALDVSQLAGLAAGMLAKAPDLPEQKHQELQQIVEAVGRAPKYSKNGSLIIRPFSYYLHKYSGGVFHTFKETYGPPVEREPLDKVTIVVHEVSRSLRGITMGLDLTGGAELVYDIQFGREENLSASAEEVKSVLEERVNALGLKEPVIQLAGNRRILVQVPATKSEDIDKIRQVIEGTGHLEFRLVCSNETILKNNRPGDEPPEGYHWYRTKSLRGEGDWELISDSFPTGGGGEVFPITGDMVTGAELGQNQHGQVVVRLDFNAEGRWNFYQVTSAHVKERLAIILDDVREGDRIVQQGTLYSAPVIQTAISSGAEISGQFTFEEADRLRMVLTSGKLPAALRLSGINQVGPTLGEASIRSGTRAIVIGLAAVLVFMAIYYLWAGCLADFALLFNMVMLVGALAVLGATLTLPGIAGIILTVGMSVDANVLIFERIREEHKRKADKPMLGVLRDGYHRAMPAIIDSNLTTFFTALILLKFGTGPVRGFAVTLSIGILFSMFTALFVTRTIFEWLVMARLVTRMKMLQIIGDTQVPFMKIAPRAIVVSVVLIAMGLGLFGYKGRGMLDTDFVGGTSLQVVMKEEVSPEWVKERLAGVGLGESSVQTIVASEEAGQRQHSEFLIRTRYMSVVDLDVNPVPPVDASGQAAPFGGGLRIVATSDKPFDLAKLQHLFRARNHPKAEVNALSEEQNGRAAQAEILVESPREATVRQQLVEIFSELSVRSDVEQALEEKLADDPAQRFARINAVGPSVAKKLQTAATIAIVLSLLVIVAYIWFRFELRYGIAAVIALVHDVSITLGALALFGVNINLQIVAAILTIIGYSLNDTIVVFDRIRENLGMMRREDFQTVVDTSINQTLSRTLLTSLTTLLAVLSLYIWGGGVIHDFALALLVGILVGTYSSIFIASPILVFARRRELARQRTT